MGNLLSACLQPMNIEYDLEEWKNWGGHPDVKRYLVGKQLGSGAFSEVYLAKRKPLVFDGEEVALKVIFLGNPKLAQGAKQLLKTEAEILEKLSHPNIVDVRRTFMWEKKQILIIEEEVLLGEELLTAAAEAISKHAFEITESFAARVMRQVFKALAYMHSRRVLHRDLKAENLCLTLPTKEWVEDISKLKVKIIDFGLSCVMGSQAEVGWLGTPGFVAPEVIDRKPHSPAMDMYAAGVILFILLTGMKPLDNDEAEALSYSNLEADEYSNMVGNRRWDSVSARGQSLVLKLMERDPQTRLTAKQALEHPFMKHKWASAAKSAAEVPSMPAAGPADAVATSAGTPKAEKAALAMKETDSLQVDGDTVASTVQAERWRELLAIARQVKGTAGGSPGSTSSPEGVPADVQGMWRKALVRGYMRTQRGPARYTSRRFRNESGAIAVSPPFPPLPRRAASTPALRDMAAADLREAGVQRSSALRQLSRAPGSLPPMIFTLSLSASFGGSSGDVGGSGKEVPLERVHERAVMREQLEQMMEDHVLADEGAEEELKHMEGCL